MEVVSWDFCGTGPSWHHVGMYDSNLGLDPTGGTPDVSAGGTIVEVLNGAMAANASDWGYPATFYNTGSAVLAGEDVHSAVNWQAGDSCVWIGTDMDPIEFSSLAQRHREIDHRAPDTWQCSVQSAERSNGPLGRSVNHVRAPEQQAHIECAEVSLELRPGPGIAIDDGHFGERKGIAGRALQRACQEQDRPLAFSA